MESSWSRLALCGCLLAAVACSLGGEPPRTGALESEHAASRQASLTQPDRAPALRTGAVLTDAELPPVATAAEPVPADTPAPGVRLPAVSPAIARVLEQPRAFDGIDTGHDLAISFGRRAVDTFDATLGAASVIDAGLPEPEIPDPTPVPAAPAFDLR